MTGEVVIGIINYYLEIVHRKKKKKQRKTMWTQATLQRMKIKTKLTEKTKAVI